MKILRYIDDILCIREDEYDIYVRYINWWKYIINISTTQQKSTLDEKNCWDFRNVSAKDREYIRDV